MTTLITLIVVDTFTKGLAISVVIVFVILFFILLYQLSKVEHDVQKWRKQYFDAKEEGAKVFSENIELRAQANNLCDKLNDCQLKHIEALAKNVQLNDEIEQLNKTDNI